jgi:hypothetical protein
MHRRSTSGCFKISGDAVAGLQVIPCRDVDEATFEQEVGTQSRLPGFPSAARPCMACC